MILLYLNLYFRWTSVDQKLSHVWQGGGRPNVGPYGHEERFLNLSIISFGQKGQFLFRVV